MTTDCVKAYRNERMAHAHMKRQQRPGERGQQNRLCRPPDPHYRRQSADQNWRAPLQDAIANVINHQRHGVNL